MLLLLSRVSQLLLHLLGKGRLAVDDAHVEAPLEHEAVLQDLVDDAERREPRALGRRRPGCRERAPARRPAQLALLAALCATAAEPPSPSACR